MHILRLIAALALLAFTSCSEKDAEKAEAAPKHDENIVTLTKESLQHD